MAVVSINLNVKKRVNTWLQTIVCREREVSITFRDYRSVSFCFTLPVSTYAHFHLRKQKLGLTRRMGKTVSHHIKTQNKVENLESFALLWLDADVDTNDENRRAQKQLRNIINHLKTFDNESECEEYISSISQHDRVVFNR